MSSKIPPSHATGALVADNLNLLTAGQRGPALLQGPWLLEKLAHFDREFITERRMHLKAFGAHGFPSTHHISHICRASEDHQMTVDEVASELAIPLANPVYLCPP